MSEPEDPPDELAARRARKKKPFRLSDLRVIVPEGFVYTPRPPMPRGCRYIDLDDDSDDENE